MKKITYTIIFVFALVFTAQAQRASYFKRVFVDAEYYLLYEDYRDALPFYMELHNAFPDNANVAYRIGLCYLNIPNQKEKSIPFFEMAMKDVTQNYREGYYTEKQAPKEAYLHYGRALRIIKEFDKAKLAFSTYRGMLKENETEEKIIVNKEIASLDIAQALIDNPIDVVFTSAGRTVNTRFAEVYPVVCANNDRLIYTSVQQFYNAIMLSEKRAGVWTHPVNLNSQMFADGPIHTVGISADGNTLLLARNDNDIYNIYTSTYDTTENTWGIISRMPREINSRHWENYASFSPTGDTLFFSSNRPDGEGDFDIYMSTRTETGWSQAVNLGDIINTPFDEIAPVMSFDGKKLFFASKGHQTIGGFDIFVSHLNNGKWTKPQNMGYPLNTPDDDVFFFPIGDGSSGYVSRVLPQTVGENDIYLVEFKKENKLNGAENGEQYNAPITQEKVGFKTSSSNRYDLNLLP